MRCFSLSRIPTTLALLFTLSAHGTAAARLTVEAPAAALSDDEKLDKARQIYGQAEQELQANRYAAAANLYEEAYYLVPTKHGFAFKVGMSAFKAGDCPRADEYLKHFLKYGNQDKHGEKISEAKLTLGEISASGCAQPSAPAATGPAPSKVAPTTGNHTSAVATTAPAQVEEAAPIEDQPELSSSRSRRADAAANARDDADRERRGPMFVAGLLLTGVGVAALGVGGTTLVLANNTANKLADLSSNTTATGFPPGDFSLGKDDPICSSDPDSCPYILHTRLETLNYITPIALGGGGVALLAGVTLLLLERRRRGGEDDVAGNAVALRAIGPMLVPRGAGAAATIQF
ncbi:MAG: hypothetical protein V3V08_02295 [Nannocystaceae bacterium]